MFRDLDIQLGVSERIALDRAARGTDKRRLKKARKDRFNVLVGRFKNKMRANPESIRMRKEDIDYIYESYEISRAKKEL